MTPPYFCNFLIISPLKRTWSYICTNWNFLLCENYLYLVWLKLASYFWKRRFLKIFSNVNTCKNGFPHFGLTQRPGTIIFTNLNIHYIRKLFCKSELFMVCGSWEEDFCIFVIISLVNSTWPLICTISNSLYLRMSCIKFDWNWSAGSGEEDFLKFWVNFTLLPLSPR
jgi:hypothetical protein